MRYLTASYTRTHHTTSQSPLTSTLLCLKMMSTAPFLSADNLRIKSSAAHTKSDNRDTLRVQRMNNHIDILLICNIRYTYLHSSLPVVPSSHSPTCRLRSVRQVVAFLGVHTHTLHDPHADVLQQAAEFTSHAIHEVRVIAGLVVEPASREEARQHDTTRTCNQWKSRLRCAAFTWRL